MFIQLLMTVIIVSQCAQQAASQEVIASECCTANSQTPPKEVQGYYDIGGFHQPVSTDSARAQLWFDRGLAMCDDQRWLRQSVRCIWIQMTPGHGRHLLRC